MHQCEWATKTATSAGPREDCSVPWRGQFIEVGKPQGPRAARDAHLVLSSVPRAILRCKLRVKEFDLVSSATRQDGVSTEPDASARDWSAFSDPPKPNAWPGLGYKGLCA